MYRGFHRKARIALINRLKVFVVELLLFIHLFLISNSLNYKVLYFGKYFES